MITDTQIISYYFRGSLSMPAVPVRISSITAAEFLLIQSRKPSKAMYYPILPALIRHRGLDVAGGGSSSRIGFESRRHSAAGKHRTDQLLLNFGNDVPAFVEFGSVAITQLINAKHDQLYASSILHLAKELQKKLRERFRFLVENEITCVAITPAVAAIAMNLFAQFLDRYEPKRDSRNTINDLLILATAIIGESEIRTGDDLLRRFTAEVMGVVPRQEGNQLVIDFSTPGTSDRRKPLESKGYIHRGWQILERRGR